mmetsp:Transcript_37795/g.63502  ORF Transcript_37795/g.63502 Transcript_37795/m.63502 type:complete len:442 (+) Transcript_37795:1-1326(+)
MGNDIGNEWGDQDGPVREARIMDPRALQIHRATGELYFSDRENHRIRKIDNNGVLHTVAGDGDIGLLDGPSSQAKFWFPMGISFDREGNLFVCDSLNHRIRRISVSGEVTTFAGGGVVTTVWGKHMEVAHEGFWDGSLTTAKFMGPNGVLVDERRGTIFIADSNNFRIRRIEANSTDVTTLAGRSWQGSEDGKGTRALFWNPEGMVVDSKGDLFVSDPYGFYTHDKHRIRQIRPNGEVTTFVGSIKSYGERDGVGTYAKFWGIHHLAIDERDNIYAVERLNCHVRRITPTGEVTTMAGASTRTETSHDGFASAATFNLPHAIAVSWDATKCYVAEDKARIRVIEPLLRRDTPFDTTDLRLEVLNITVSRQGKSRIYKANLAKGNRPYDTEAATRPARGTGDQASFSRGRGTGRRGGRGRRGAGGKRGASGVGNSDSDDVSD